MHKAGQKGFYIGDWRVSPAEGVLIRGGETVRLEPKAMDVLVYFASRPSEVVTREELEHDVWRGALVGYDAVTNTVIKLRKALQDDARQPRFIATIPKKGYQLIAAVTCPDNGSGSTVPAGNAPVPARPPGIRIAVAAMAAIFAFGLLWLWPSAPPPIEPETPADSRHSAKLPSIVVLPFVNLSDDPKQDYLAEGITEDIITDLSRLSSLLVISSNTSSLYKDKEVSPEQIGTDLNVGFALKGTTRQLGDEVRVNAQLVNTKTGFNVWAQRYDRKVAEVFAVQDEVTHSIVNALAIKITNQEKQRLAQRATGNLKAYDFFLEGQRIFKIHMKETNEQARVMYRKAIELDPGYGRAYGALAVTLAYDFRNGWADAPVASLDRALELAKQAVALDDSVPQTYWALGFVYLWQKEYAKAKEAALQAIRIAPNYADGYGLLGLINSNLGNAEKAIELNDKAVRLNPYYSFEYLIPYGIAYYTLGDYDAAITVLEQARRRNANSEPVRELLAASYVKAGRLEDAEWEIIELQLLNPSATISGLEKALPIAKPELKRALLADLRTAGLPE